MTGNFCKFNRITSVSGAAQGERGLAVKVKSTNPKSISAWDGV